MKEALVSGKPVVAGTDAPDRAVCPDCGTEVQKRHVKRMDGGITCFYRHKRGEGKAAPRWKDYNDLVRAAHRLS